MPSTGPWSAASAAASWARSRPVASGKLRPTWPSAPPSTGTSSSVRKSPRSRSAPPLASGGTPFATFDDIHDVRRFLCVGDDDLTAVFTTAGGTGEPKRVYYNLLELERITNFNALALRVQHRGRLHALIALPMRQGLWIGSAAARNVFRRAGGLPIPVGAGDPEETLRWMRRFEPNVVASFPSYMAVLTDVARETVTGE